MKATRSTTIIAALAAATVLTALTACSTGDAGGDGGEGGAPVIGFSESKLTDSFQVLLVKGIEAEAEGAGIDLLPVVDAGNDPAKQNEDINTLLTRGVDALLVVPVDSKAIVPAIQKANDEGVPVVTVDAGADGGRIDMLVRADNYKMGETACEHMGELTGGSGTVLNLQGGLESTNGRDRSDGFTDCITEKFPDIEVISKPMEWSPEKCADQAQSVLSTTEVDGIYVGSEVICLAAVQTVLASNNLAAKVGEDGHIPFIGIDGSPEALDAIRAGTLDAVVSQPLDQYIDWALFYLKAFADGETFEAGPTDHDSTIVADGDSLQDLLTAPLVTSDNVDDAALWGNG